MSSTSTEVAVAIPLKAWQDPQGDVVLHHSRGDCIVYFGCWKEAGVPADYLCKLTFNRGWAVRGYCFDYHPYEVKEHRYHSNIYEVENSRWLKQAGEQRADYYPGRRDRDSTTYHHYLVHGHDNFYEILAAGFTESVVQRGEAGDLVRLIEEA
jgi:hypothetical protein